MAGISQTLAALSTVVRRTVPQAAPFGSDAVLQRLHLTLDAFRMRQHRLPPHRERIAAGASYKERGAERFLEHGDAARDSGLRDLQAAPRGERAARARNGEEETQVVPIEHVSHIASG